VERKLGIKTPFVFIRFDDGKPFAYFAKYEQREKASQYFYKHWRGALKKAKIADRRPHDLRRAAAIRRDAAGISVDDNMRLGGWETSEMLKRYLDAKGVEDLRAAAKEIDQHRQKSEPSQKPAKPSQKMAG
jgi:integrase